MHTPHTMQFCQPPFQPQPTGFPNYSQPCGPMPTRLDGYAEIIGEGNVASIICPDGSKQFIFYPTLLWPPQWRTFLQNPYMGNLNNPYMDNLGVWFVRNIFNPIQPTVFPQPRPELFSAHYPRVVSSDHCLNLGNQRLPLQFHHDTCTSTTDIQYFIPKQFNWFQRPTECAAVQVSCAVENSATACDSELPRNEPNNSTNEPCHCPDEEDKKTKESIKCVCRKKSNSSRMSIDSKRSRRKLKSRKRSKKSSHTCECSEPATSYRQKNTKKSSSKMSVDSTSSSSCRHKKSSRKSNRSKYSSHTCECSEPSIMSDSSISSSTRCTKRTRKSKRVKTKKSHVKCECRPLESDKCVTTYTEQAIGCAPDKGQKTQTTCNGVPVIKVSKRACNNMCQKAETWKFTRCSCDSNSSRSINSSADSTSGT